MTPMAGFFGLGPTELVIILVVLAVLFGGSRLAGLGKSSGRAIREFKEETKGLMGEAGLMGEGGLMGADEKQPEDEIVEAELVESPEQPPAQQPVSSAPQPAGNDA